MNIAIQGVAGSFHDAAAQSFFSRQPHELIYCSTFSGVFAALDKNQAKYGVAAVENSLYGSIHETYDRIAEHHFPIVGEVVLNIHQQLVANLGTNLSDITEVVSHPAALDQCRNFLETHLPHAELIEYHDTAAAADHVHRTGGTHLAAIASSTAAALYSLEIVAHNIEDHADNATRFVIITKEPSRTADANKATLVLVTSHQPGALYRALGVFNTYGSNLTKIESRPLRGERFNYQFLVDVIANENQLVSAINDLGTQSCRVSLLGHYRSSEL